MAASSQDDTMQAITLGFFNRIPRAGFPPSKQQSQKWKELGLPQPAMTTKQQCDDDRMVVMLSMRHDYGSSGLGGY